MQSICVREGSRVPNLQTEFNYLDSFKSNCIFSDFIVPTLSPSSPRHPHIIPIAPTRSPCGPHGCGLHCLHPMLSLWSPRHPHGTHCPQVVPVVPTSSPHCLEGPHIIPNLSIYPHLPTTAPGGWGPQIKKKCNKI